jgi:hypothetical protein
MGRLSLAYRHPAHSHRIDRRPMGLFHFGQQVDGCLSGKSFDVVDQVNLIVIPKRMRDLGPRFAT